VTRRGLGGTSKRDELLFRKRHGIFYTPEPIARYLVRSTLTSLALSQQGFATLKVVDPACGDGAFLWEAYKFLCDIAGANDEYSRLDIIRNQIFGVDLDPDGIGGLRLRLTNDILKTGSVNEAICLTATNQQETGRSIVNDCPVGNQHVERSEEDSLDLMADVLEVLQANFHVGDAVAGPAWIAEDSDAKLVLGTEGGPLKLDWAEAFPLVTQAGGFDIVFANPPYRRERGAKQDLAGMDESSLGNARRAARMDLWHYFFHRSLDLLRPGGTLGLIVNSAWTTSQAGQPIITRLEKETTPQEFILLERSPVFDNVDGRHLILRLRKSIANDNCRIWKLKESHFPSVRQPQIWEDLLNQDGTHPNSNGHSGIEQPLASASSGAFEGFFISRDELFQSGRLWLHRPKAIHLVDLQHSSLLDRFDVRQGIAENPPRITRRHAETNAAWKVGQGVFLLSAQELADLNLSETEQHVLRPYYEGAVIDRYWIPERPSGWLLYLTRETAPHLDEMPHIAEHLQKFRPILEQRRETRLGKLAWWHLHWPREARLFDNAKILAVQMGSYPRFVAVSKQAYVGFSVNLIVENAAKADAESSSLDALAAILNSRFAANWFDHHAKRRGVHIDITGGTLKRFPMPNFHPELTREVDTLSKLRSQREAEFRLMPTRENKEPIHELDQQINDAVDRWFEVTGKRRVATATPSPSGRGPG
jgi:hypothetical protein